MRGTPHILGDALAVRRIIPAYAGNTQYSLYCCAFAWDHPRACGEHRAGEGTQQERQGSSPRMRGTLQQAGAYRGLRGIIPAYAGNTNHLKSGQWILGDHPRVCGEHPRPNVVTWVRPGSSPRMRGTRLPALSHQPRKWDHPRVCGEHLDLTPETQAEIESSPRMRGNTSLPSGTISPRRDHPRVCGEHGMADIGDAFSSGSSPRMRGTRIVARGCT